MPSPSLDQIITEIEQWFAETMHNSVVSRDVTVYNHVRAAYEELKSRIAALVSGKPATAPASVEEPTLPSGTEPKSKPAA